MSDFFSLLVPFLEVTVSIIKTVKQSDNSTNNKCSEEYTDATARCIMHPNLITRLGMKEGNIRLETDYGNVILKAIPNAEDTVPEDLVLVPFGPWAQKVTTLSADGRLIKNLEAKIRTSKEDIQKFC